MGLAGRVARGIGCGIERGCFDVVFDFFVELKKIINHIGWAVLEKAGANDCKSGVDELGAVFAGREWHCWSAGRGTGATRMKQWQPRAQPFFCSEGLLRIEAAPRFHEATQLGAANTCAAVTPQVAVTSGRGAACSRLTRLLVAQLAPHTSSRNMNRMGVPFSCITDVSAEPPTPAPEKLPKKTQKVSRRIVVV